MGKLLLSIIALLLFVLALYFGYRVVHEGGFAPKDTVVRLQNGARLEWQKCWFKAGDNIHCGRMFTAPEVGAEDSSFSLPVVVFRYTGFDREEDAVVEMAGGPGASSYLEAEQIVGYWEGIYKEYKLKRDLVIFDQRGAGLSEPKLTCPDYYEAIRNQLANKYAPSENARLTHEALKNCHDRLIRAGIPLNEISTLKSAKDVRDLMDLLGYERWNLFGASYSTRLATVIEQQNRDKVRSMILDSVYPVQRHFFKEWPGLMNTSLERIFGYCERYDSCNAEYGDVRDKLWKTLAMLQENPLEVKLREGLIEGLDKVYINDETYLSILFQAEYESGILYELPAVIDAFLNRDVDFLEVYIYNYLRDRLDESMSEMVFWSIECKDNPPLNANDVAQIYQEYPQLQRYLIPEYDPCDIWNGDGAEATDLKIFSQPSQTPVLVLAGEDDPVTPVEWANDIFEQYQNAQIFRFPHVSHIVMDSKLCGSELLSEFVANPNLRPTADCREEVGSQGSVVSTGATTGKSQPGEVQVDESPLMLQAVDQ